MIRKALIAVLLLYLGLLAGEIPTGDTTFGHSAWLQTHNALLWGNTQLQSLVSYSGLGDSAAMKWLSKIDTSPKPPVRKIRIPGPVGVSAPAVTAPPSEPHSTDGEDLTPLDKEALRKILE